MREEFWVTLLVKLGAVACLASFLVRSSAVKRMLLEENRTLGQRLRLALWFSAVFATSVAASAPSTSWHPRPGRGPRGARAVCDERWSACS